MVTKCVANSRSTLGMGAGLALQSYCTGLHLQDAVQAATACAAQSCAALSRSPLRQGEGAEAGRAAGLVVPAGPGDVQVRPLHLRYHLPSQNGLTV